MTAVEIIKETVEFYQNNRRGLNGETQCVYFNESTGAECAVGRCINKDNPVVKENLFCLEGDVVELDDFLEDNGGLEGVLKEQYKGQAIRFWTELQVFHDGNSYWEQGKETMNSLTEAGKIHLNKLVEAWNN